MIGGLERIESTAIEIAPLRAADAARLLADRACLALALACGGPAMTADRVWVEVDVGVRVQVVR